MNSASKTISFKEKQIPFWQLGFMLSAGQGLIPMTIGTEIGKASGYGTAITSIVLGNFILFFVGLAIISMTGLRSHTIQNIKENFKSKFASLLAIIIVASFLIWYAMQIKHPTQLISNYFCKSSDIDINSTLLIRIGSILGLLCAIASMWGISFIKWFNSLAYLFQVLFILFMFFTLRSTEQLYENHWSFSFIGVLKVVFAWLPGMINLSAFIRHAKSREDAVLSLFYIFLSHALFQIFFLHLGHKGLLQNFLYSANYSFTHIWSLIFIITSFFSVNFLNIYWASIGLESFFFKEQGAKGYAVIGLIGTTIYIFFQSSESIIIAQTLATSFIANLGMVLITSALVKSLMKNRVRSIDKIDNAICWTFSSLSTIGIYLYTKSGLLAALYGINTAFLSSGFVVFLEELIWAAKKWYKQKKHPIV